MNDNNAMIAYLLAEISQLEARLAQHSGTNSVDTTLRQTITQHHERIAQLGGDTMLSTPDVNCATQKATVLVPKTEENSQDQSILAAFAHVRAESETNWKQESRALRQAIAPFARRFRLDLLHGCTPAEFQHAVLHMNPHIVHIQAHGSQDGLQCEDVNGAMHQLDWAALHDLIIATPNLRCVILNACDIRLAMALEPLPCQMITTPGNVISEATLTFTFGFYDALALGRSITDCYAVGCEYMRQQGYTADTMPFLRSPAA